MQMRGAHVERAADIFRRGTDRLKGVMVKRRDLLIAIAVLKMRHIGMFVADLAGMETGMGYAGFQMTGDFVFFDQSLVTSLASSARCQSFRASSRPTSASSASCSMR